MKVTKLTPKGSIRVAHRKENHFMEEYAGCVITDSGTKIKKAVTLRIYGTNRMSYACIWINGNGVYASGSGSAGGYGYHMASAAAQEAIEAAGIELSESISGRGDSAQEEAVEAIVKKLYPRHKYIQVLKAHA